MDFPQEGLQLQSLVTPDGELRLSLSPVALPEPGPDQVVVRIQAAPINPSDLLLMLGPVDPASLTTEGQGPATVVRGRVPQEAIGGVSHRMGKSLPVGNEGAGVVIAAGSSESAQSLLGRTVAIFGGGTFSEYRVADAQRCLVFPGSVSAREAAAAFVNPLTALSMVETLRQEGHVALVHTAAASSLGQMLNRICLADGTGLVNIVRSQEQTALLTEAGARHVCNSSAPTFEQDLAAAIAATGATIGFDAIRGGRLAGQILAAIERVAVGRSGSYSPYGSTVRKQVYIYGGLGPGPMILEGWYGMAWGLGGFLLDPSLSRFGPETAAAMRRRVAAEIKTTFATNYAGEFSLPQALDLSSIAQFAQRATGGKFLITPGAG